MGDLPEYLVKRSLEYQKSNWDLKLPGWLRKFLLHQVRWYFWFLIVVTVLGFLGFQKKDYISSLFVSGNIIKGAKELKDQIDNKFNELSKKDEGEVLRGKSYPYERLYFLGEWGTLNDYNMQKFFYRIGNFAISKNAISDCYFTQDCEKSLGQPQGLATGEDAEDFCEEEFRGSIASCSELEAAFSFGLRKFFVKKEKEMLLWCRDRSPVDSDDLRVYTHNEKQKEYLNNLYPEGKGLYLDEDENDAKIGFYCSVNLVREEGD